MSKTILSLLGTLLSGLFVFIPANIYSDDMGFKYFKNYTYKEYDHQPKNWGMVQAENGILYVANDGGVLQYDGVSWRVIQTPGYDHVHSLAIDDAGILYVGGRGKIGRLVPGANGALEYESLLNKPDDDNHKKFSTVYRTHAVNESVYFVTRNLLFRWRDGKMKVWEEEKNPFSSSFVCGDEFYVRKVRLGIMQVVNDSLEPIPGGDTFSGAKNYMMTSYKGNEADPGDRRQLIGTRKQGIYLYDGETAERFPTAPGLDEFLEEKKFSHGIRLVSGDFALATLRGGVIIMDPAGRWRHTFDKAYGLQDQNVKYVFEDNRGNLWLCLDKGITKIEYASPITVHDERSGLSGLPSAVVKHHNDLYVGTSSGLYYLDSPRRFRPVHDITGNCWSLLSHGDSLLAASYNGVFQINNTGRTAQIILKNRAYILIPSRYYPGRVWCGTENGLTALSMVKGRWKVERRFENISQKIRFMVEVPNGPLWLVTETNDVLKVDLPFDDDPSKITGYGVGDGLPKGRVYPAWAAGHAVFATDKGLYRFDQENSRFVSDMTLGDDYAGGEKAKPVFRVVEDENNHIWFHSKSRNYRAVPVSGGGMDIQVEPFLRLPAVQANVIYPAPDGKAVWFGNFDGLFRYDTTLKSKRTPNFKTLIRKVTVNGAEIFNGCRNHTGPDEKELLPVIEYKNRNMDFEFAAPFFEAETETLYQCILEGYDDHWSDWSKDSKRSYTNLDAGVYTFRVRAKNVSHHIGDEDVFPFKVLPPWYGTWWAYLIYALAMTLLVILIVKWRSGKLEREKQHLEHIVSERTREINQKNQQLKQQTRQLEQQTLQLLDQSEELKEMSKVKSRFFANISHEFRTPLTLIMGPLEQMFSDSRDTGLKNKLRMMLRNSQRVLTQINQLLDLSRFDSGKQKLQAARQNLIPFLKGVTASFEALAQKNRLSLECRSRAEAVFLYFDTQKMEVVITNLLLNAVKFTPPGGSITVSVSQGSKGFVEISVKDTGKGISREQLDHIFDRFYQADGPEKTGGAGAGIGLALVRENILLHRGKIDVHSREGEGTEFVILLPAGRDHLKDSEIAPSAPSPPASPDHLRRIAAAEDAEMGNGLNGNGDDANDDTAPKPQPETQEKNVILAVEDNDDMRKYIRESLETDYTVKEARDGGEGIAKAREIIPDLIVSDIMMPEIDGNELCRVLKKDVTTSHIPIILLTAKASQESIIEGLETGADDYITKPFNSKMLSARIKNLIDLRRQLQLKIQRQKMLLPAEISVSSVDESFLEELQEIIEKNLPDPKFHVEQLSEKLYMNRVTLFRKVKALTGESPTEFIRSYRLERAAQLLRDNFGNVSEVAIEVGFSNLGHFTRCFKKKFQQLPSTYNASESPQAGAHGTHEKH